MRNRGGWSTRELAGTTLKTVRHYHRLRLPEEPERAANSYKQYGPAPDPATADTTPDWRPVPSASSESATAAENDLDALAEDASEEARQNLAERLAPDVHRRQKHPHLREFAEQDAAGHRPRNWPVFLHAVVELYNPAQIDVLQRVNVIRDRTSPTGAGPTTSEPTGRPVGW